MNRNRSHAFIVFAIVSASVACSETPATPTRMTPESLRPSPATSADTTSTPVVTLLPDLTASPAQVTVYSKNTLPFTPAGKTCDYFAWDTNWSRQIFPGQVLVE